MLSKLTYLDDTPKLGDATNTRDATVFAANVLPIVRSIEAIRVMPPKELRML